MQFLMKVSTWGLMEAPTCLADRAAGINPARPAVNSEGGSRYIFERTHAVNVVGHTNSGAPVDGGRRIGMTSVAQLRKQVA